MPLIDIRAMGHRAKYIISPKEDKVDLKCSPLSNSQDMGHHFQVHLKYLQHGLEKNPGIRLTTSASTAPGQLPGAHCRPSIDMPTKQFQQGAEVCRTNVAGIADVPSLPDISYHQDDAK
jgi:hypothetical protein